MGQPFVGEVRLVGFNFPPSGWATCAGQLLAISEFETLFNLIGTTYGGDGQSTFAVPDLQGRTPIHMGSNGVSNYVIGEKAGVEQVTLTINQYPNHRHSLLASSNPGGVNSPANNVTGAANIYGTPVGPQMSASALTGSGGGNQPHDNRQPYLVLNWVISMFGVFPTQG